MSLCCVPACGKTRSDNVILHKFPNPDLHPDRFRTWMYAIGGDILEMSNHAVYNKRRVCHVHFENTYVTWSKLLSANAVPTLHLPGATGILHAFPNPASEKNREKFDEWVKNVGLAGEDETRIYKNRRVCNLHFEKIYHYPNNRLSKYAVPRLHLTSSKATQGQPKPTESKVLKPTATSVQVYKSPRSRVLKPTDFGVRVLKPETSVEEQATDAEITYQEEEYLETFGDDLGHEVEEQPKKEGPFSWQKYTEEIVALDENVTDDDVKFCGEVQLVPDSSEPVSQTQEEYLCNACNQRITGARYVCVECADWDLCGACEARRHHARHYVLRVPPGKPRSETAWVIAALRQMLASREDPDLTLVKEEVKSEDPLAGADAPCGARARGHQTRDLDTVIIEDVDERIDTDRTSYLPSTPQKRSTTAHPEAVQSKKPKHVILKAVPIQRKDITGNVVILGKHKPDNSQDIATRTTQKKLHIISMDDLKKHIPQLETSKVTTWDDTRKQNVTATIQKPKLQNETGTVISLDDLRKQTVPVLKQTSQQETKKVITLDDLMKETDVVDKKQKIIAAPVEKKESQIGADKIILQKGVISLMKPTHAVDSPKIIVTAGPGKQTSHIESRVSLLSKKIVKLEEPKRVTVSEKFTPESGETILLDDTISDIVQPTESAVTESPAESWNTVQAVETSSGGSIKLKVLENPRQLRVNMVRLRDDDNQNATQPSTSKR